MPEIKNLKSLTKPETPRKTKKYVANMSFAGKNIKLGAYETVEAAFLRYKEYKEDFIKDIAEQHKDKIPNKIYQAMMNWQIEITD